MPYCTRDHIGEIIGADNAAKYADRDNDGNSATIDAVIDAAIAWADAAIDGLFRDGPYAVPFSPVPALVADWSARLAAFRLYQARGLSDRGDDIAGQMKHLHDQVFADMRRYAAGSLRLDVPTQHQGPTAPVSAI